ncbi:MAG: hypothetical protein WAV82_10070 [Methylobacter sp.]
MPTTDPKNVKDIVTNLNAGWYNVVTEAMQVTDPNFQLAQGVLGLQTEDSSGLFLISDAVPEPAAVAYYDPSGLSKRSSAYQLLLASLLPETGTDLAGFLKDMYPSWVEYRINYYKTNPTSTLTPQQVFSNWANQNLDPRKVEQAVNTFLQAANAPLNQALAAMADPASTQKFLDTAQKSYLLYKYSATNDGARAAINTGGTAIINFDSDSMNTTLKSTLVNGSASGFYELFSDAASGSFEQLNTIAARQRFTINGTINKYATLAVDPINWFNSAEFMRAYNAPNDNTVWDPQANAGTWDSFFGQPDGSLAARVNALLLVSDYQITVTSLAEYTQEDYQKIQAEASFGFWPFFSASASATHETKYELNSNANLVVTHTLNKGLIQIWGAFVRNAPK